MIKPAFLTLATILILFSTACTDSGTKKVGNKPAQTPEQIENDLFSEVMRIHDEVMPKMADLNRVKRSLKGWTDTHPNHSDSARVAEAISSMSSAEISMMDWMRGISAHRPEVMRKAGDSHEAILQALNLELAAIEQVRDDMMTSLVAAQELQQQLASNQ